MRNYFLNSITSILLLLALSKDIYAQDNYSGTWSCQGNDYLVELMIGEADHQVIYPSLLHIKTKLFEGNYYALLAKKDFRNLYINREKWTKVENFNSEGISSFLAGKLHYSKDLKGNGILELERMPSPNEITKKVADEIPASVFSSEKLLFKKKDPSPVADTGFYRLMQPAISPVYFGISKDTIATSTKEMGIHFNSGKDKGISSLKVNQQIIADEYDISESKDDESVFLDTGINHIVLFAENYGKKKGDHGGVELLMNKSRSPLTFEQEKNKNAIFLVQRILFNDPYSDPWKINRKKYPDIDWNKNRKISSIKKNTTPNQKEEVIGEIFTRSADLTFAIWDDALEDGDSISLQINDEWISRGFSVKNKPQFLRVHLTPGPNVITFLADNLGTIPPNTSVLEIIDGSKRKSFHIETDKDLSNQVRIYYEIN